VNAGQGWLADWLAERRERVDDALDRLLAERCGPQPRLAEAMRYAALGPGKRLRPILCLATAETLDGDFEVALTAGLALELIHAYSLVHDDLPAMDDDDLRRGRPTCHRAFDEATAILTGDALQTLAFEVVTGHPALNGVHPQTRIAMAAELAAASGASGMAGGQALDLAGTGTALDERALERVHRLKTGALIRAAVRLGALAADCHDPAVRAALDGYAGAMGLAFQVVDDLLDVEGDTEAIGKPAGSDAAAGKSTYPILLGVTGARERAAALADEARDALARLPRPAPHLEALLEQMVARKR